MNSKFPIVLASISICLLVLVSWRSRNCAQRLMMLEKQITEIASSNANRDVARGSAYLYVHGLLPENTQDVSATLATHGLQIVPTGCGISDDAWALYTRHYNRTMQAGLTRKHGADILNEIGSALELTAAQEAPDASRDR